MWLLFVAKCVGNSIIFFAAFALHVCNHFQEVMETTIQTKTSWYIFNLPADRYFQNALIVCHILSYHFSMISITNMCFNVL